ncbi:hypothetical protein FRC06_011201 [Ceratobasidium sp. 370]|nr:hypothetical protein FRC06_011201 [Ceratobasidium sp. 370]
MSSLLSAKSFPTLRHLDLMTPSFDHVSAVMSTRHLVGRLEILNIIFDHNELERHGIESAGDDRFQRLFADTPCLSDLKLAISNRTGLFPFDNTMLRVLARLPLQSVSLHGIYPDDAGREDLGNIWPKVTKMRMPDHSATLAKLGPFTRIPNLRRLELRLKFNQPTAPDSLDGYVSVAPLEGLESSASGRMCFHREELDVIE